MKIFIVEEIRDLQYNQINTMRVCDEQLSIVIKINYFIELLKTMRLCNFISLLFKISNLQNI